MFFCNNMISKDVSLSVTILNLSLESFFTIGIVITICLGQRERSNAVSGENQRIKEDANQNLQENGLVEIRQEHPQVICETLDRTLDGDQEDEEELDFRSERHKK